jgi:hypothetical protein
MIPDDGEANGKTVDSLAMDEFTDLRLRLRVPISNLLEFVLAKLSNDSFGPNACGITQISLELVTPAGQRFCPKASEVKAKQNNAKNNFLQNMPAPP